MPNGEMNQAQLFQANAQARQLITTRALKKTQQILAETQATINAPVLNVVPRNAGLIVGFWVEVNALVTNVAAAEGDLTLTPFGASNLLSNILYQDLSNNTRIDTAGWHLAMVNSAKNRAPFLAARTNTGYPVDYGRNFTTLMNADTTIAQNGGTSNVRFLYWVPLAYTSTDLRGGVFANVVNATQQLQLTVNTTGAFATTGTGAAAEALYTGAANAVAAATLTNLDVKVYQCYWDQLPTDPNGKVVLPLLDLATVYEMKNTSLTGATAAQDFPIPYSNFRDFLSTTVVYENGGSLNDGTDLNTIALELANFTNIWKVEPKIVKAWERQVIRDDFPSGVYYLESRDRPVSTIQFGNMQLLFNPSTVNANARFLVGFEDFAMINAVPGAGSLPAG